ncbi:MAG: uroporphyrinogen-III C-methyltransferase [Betaproteobacteria bacterium]|nr:uroporphyrinogen-III C-methyltransferase [Betaproteobacteria bacterium]
MNSHTSSNDDSLPESGTTPEQAASEQSSALPAGEPTNSVPPADEPKVSAPPVDEPTFSASALSDALPVVSSVRVRRSGGRGAAGWALLFALVSLGVAGFTLWQAYGWRTQNVGLREEVAKRLQENDNSVVESRVLAQQEHESLNSIRSKVGALESQVNKSEGHAKALETLYEQFSRSQEDRVVAEVQQAVAVAEQQLQYAGNIETALIALRAAQTRLEQNDHGQFMALRQALKTDIEKLSRHGTLDMPSMALRLEQVLGKIDKLPLVNSGEVSAEKPSAKSGEKEGGKGVGHFILGLAGDIWADLRSLVKFERLDTTTEPVLLVPEQSTFLRENVKIRLLTARLAMLARDGNTYVADLERARDWVERFFDTRNEEVDGVVKELDALKTVPVGVIRYELIESAAAVRRFQTRGGEPPPVHSPQPPVSGHAAAETPEVPETPASSAQP